MANGLFGGGTGVLGDPYLVEDAQDLNMVRSNLAGHYKQMANIDLGTWGNWEPISGDWANYAGPFTGYYNGNGYKVSNMTSEALKTNARPGLFGYLFGGTIEKIFLENPHSVGYEPQNNNGAGCLFFNIGGGAIVRKCCVISGYVVGSWAGLLGAAADGYDGRALIENCYVTGTVNTDINKNGMGGLMPDIDAVDIINCYSVAKINRLPGMTRCGGLFGTSFSLTGPNVSNCYYDKDINGIIEDEWALDRTYWEGNLIQGIDGYTYICNDTFSATSDTQRPGDGADWEIYWTLFGGQPRSTIEMKQAQGGTAYVGWDFGATWGIQLTNNGYPYFQWQTEETLNTYNDGYPYLLWELGETESLPEGWTTPNQMPQITTPTGSKQTSAIFAKVDGVWKLINKIYNGS